MSIYTSIPSANVNGKDAEMVNRKNLWTTVMRLQAMKTASLARTNVVLVQNERIDDGLDIHPSQHRDTWGLEMPRSQATSAPAGGGWTGCDHRIPQ